MMLVQADQDESGNPVWIELPGMGLQIVGGGVQWRGYCEACDMGLNWWNDFQGTEQAEQFTAAHNRLFHRIS